VHSAPAPFAPDEVRALQAEQGAPRALGVNGNPNVLTCRN
jgi:hypothetical protein